MYTKQKKRVMFDMTPKQAASDETTANPNHIEVHVENLEDSGSEKVKKPSFLQHQRALKPNQIAEDGNPLGDSFLKSKV